MAKDPIGIPYTAPSSKPATPGTRVTIHTPKGPKPGTVVGGGHVVKDVKPTKRNK
jgi:hypothetical protein